MAKSKKPENVMTQTFETLDQDAIDYMKEYASEEHLIVEILSDTHFDLYRANYNLAARVTIQEDSFKDAYKRFINFCDDYALGSNEGGIVSTRKQTQFLESMIQKRFKVEQKLLQTKKELKKIKQELEIARGAIDGLTSNNKRRM